MSAPVLRGDVTLVNRNLMEVIKAVRSDSPLPEEDLIATYFPDVPLRSLSRDELEEHMADLTGESLDLLLSMAGLDVKDQDAAIRLAHFTIIAANNTATVSQKIAASQASKKAAQAVANMLDGQDNTTQEKTPPPATPSRDPANPPPAKKAKKTKPPPPPLSE
ncbi:Hypp9708, partial [Branchiostoma lanceolatum]